MKVLRGVPLNLNVLLSAMLAMLCERLLENRKDVEGGGGNCRSWDVVT